MSQSVAAKVDAEFSQYPKRSYPKGQILLFADEAPEHIYYLVSGKVRQYDVSYRGDEIVLNLFKPGAFFSMSWAIGQLENRYFYKTEEASELHIVPIAAADEFIRNNPDVLYDLLARVYRGADGMMSKMSELMSGSAHSRLIQEIATECARFSKRGADGSCKLTISEVDLAARTGLSRETVSREMRKLKDRGWITISNKVITITNVAMFDRSSSSSSDVIL